MSLFLTLNSDDELHKKTIPSQIHPPGRAPPTDRAVAPPPEAVRPCTSPP